MHHGDSSGGRGETQALPSSQRFLLLNQSVIEKYLLCNIDLLFWEFPV